MTKKQPKVLKKKKSHMLEHTNLNAGSDWVPLHYVGCPMFFCPIWFSLSPSFSFPLCSSLFVKEETIFALSGGKPAVTGRGRKLFSNGKGRTAKCLGDAPEVLTLPGTALQSRPVALTKRDALSKEGILMTRDHPITTPFDKRSLQNFLSSRLH